MRIILYTGKGGVGKTSLAAATAVKSASQGSKTLVVSTDPAHSLGDSLNLKLGAEPVEVQENLWAQEIDVLHEIEQGWGKIQKYITLLFTSKAAKDITIEELTIFPGMEDLMSLLRVLGYYKANAFDVIIIDCAPTGETLAMLSYPEMLEWWMGRLFPLKRKVLKVVKPVAEPLLGLPLPSDSVMGEVENVLEQLDEMRRILSNRETTSVRIVVNPEKMVIKEAQRSFTYMNIYDYNVDAVIINRIFPEEIRDEYFRGWKEIQRRYTDLIEESFQPVPILKAPLFEQEIVGIPMLEKLGNTVFSEKDPIKILFNARTQEVIRDGEDYVFSIAIPFASKEELSLNKKADELILKAGLVKRTITLPRILSHLAVKDAKFDSDVLRIRFGGENQ